MTMSLIVCILYLYMFVILGQWPMLPKNKFLIEFLIVMKLTYEVQIDQWSESELTNGQCLTRAELVKVRNSRVFPHT